MKLAVSNIAWPKDQDAAVADLLREFGIRGIEIAPTKIWPKPLEATTTEIHGYRRFWNDRGISIVAAQALLFGRPDLTMFESAEVRARTLEYLAGIVRLCARLGAKSLVFGSPKNRRRGLLPLEEAKRIAVEFFRKLGALAADAGTCIVMEANPPEYGADFVTRVAEAMEFVEAVAHSGFRLHLDTGCMTLADDSVNQLTSLAGRANHFHVSEPNLDPPGTSGRVDHPGFSGALKKADYTGWISLEMRESQPFSLRGFAESLRWLAGNYAGSE